MANLIITIISIALVAVAAVMGVYYGGTAFSNSSIKAYAAQTINIVQQIKAAVLIYQASNPNYGSLTTPLQWGVALTSNNGQYLSLPYYTGSLGNYNSFNINYGNNGNLLDESNGAVGPVSGTAYIFLGALNVVPDSTGNHLYVVWLANTSNYGPTVTATAVVKFYTTLCYTINQQMGQVPYASSLTLTNNVGSTTLTIPNGGDTTVSPGFGVIGTGPAPAFTGLSNICAINPTQGYTSNPQLEFAVPIF